MTLTVLVGTNCHIHTLICSIKKEIKVLMLSKADLLKLEMSSEQEQVGT